MLQQTLQHTAAHYNTLQHTTCGLAASRGRETRHAATNTATYCSTLQHSATHYLWTGSIKGKRDEACCNKHCNILFHTATLCNTLPVDWQHQEEAKRGSLPKKPTATDRPHEEQLVCMRVCVCVYVHV